MVLKSLKSCALRCEALVCNIMKGDNVKIYMQMMDLENLEKVFFSLKNCNLLVVSFYGTVFSINN